jgi:hypothetical protein
MNIGEGIEENSEWEQKIDRLGRSRENRREEKSIIYNNSICIIVTPNVKRSKPSTSSKHKPGYKYAPHTSTIHSDRTCGVRYLEEGRGGLNEGDE